MLNMSRIFLLEDDPVLGQTMKRGFELEGYEVVWAKDLRTAVAQWQASPIDLFVLDWNLPDGTGLSLCQTIRKTQTRIPIIFLTARTDEEFAVEALSAGAHDYLRKPCGQSELLVRVKRLLGEAVVREEIIRFGDLVLHLGSRKAEIKGIEVALHRREFDVLVHLVKNGSVVSSRNAILSVIDPDQSITDRAVDAHMSRLRNRFREFGIASIEIKSIYGEGYRLEKVS